MPPVPRRALLSSIAAGSAALAGCSNPLRGAPSPDPRPVDLTGRTIYVDEAVNHPKLAGAVTTDDPTRADVAVYPADAASAPLVATLAAGVPIVAAGEDALPTVMGACLADGRSHGFAGDSWRPDTAAVAAVPATGRLDTHIFEGAALPGELPWVLREVLSPPVHDRAVDYATNLVPPGIGADATPLGTARVRGRNGAGTFDRRDRVRVAAGDDAPAIVVDVTGAIRGGTEAIGDPRFEAAAVRLVAHFEAPLAASGPAAGRRDALTVRDRTDPTERAVDHTYRATADPTSRSFTGCQRALLTPEAVPEPFTTPPTPGSPGGTPGRSTRTSSTATTRPAGPVAPVSRATRPTAVLVRVPATPPSSPRRPSRTTPVSW